MHCDAALLITNGKGKKNHLDKNATLTKEIHPSDCCELKRMFFCTRQRVRSKHATQHADTLHHTSGFCLARSFQLCAKEDRAQYLTGSIKLNCDMFNHVSSPSLIWTQEGESTKQNVIWDLSVEFPCCSLNFNSNDHVGSPEGRRQGNWGFTLWLTTHVAKDKVERLQITLTNHFASVFMTSKSYCMPHPSLVSTLPRCLRIN